MIRLHTTLMLFGCALLAGASLPAGAQQDAAGSAQQTEDGGAPMMQQRTPASPTQQPDGSNSMKPDSQRQRHEGDQTPLNAPREPAMTAPGVETERGGSVGERPERQRGQQAPPTRNETERDANQPENQDKRAWWRFWD